MNETPIWNSKWIRLQIYCNLSFLISLNLLKVFFGKFLSIRGKQCTEFDVTISILHIGQVPCCYYTFSNFETRLWKCYHLTMKADALLVQRRNTNVEKKLWTWHCNYNADITNVTSRLCCEVYLLYNVEATLVQRCYFDVMYRCSENVVTLTSRFQRCKEFLNTN